VATTDQNNKQPHELSSAKTVCWYSPCSEQSQAFYLTLEAETEEGDSIEMEMPTGAVPTTVHGVYIRNVMQQAVAPEFLRIEQLIPS
jgi:carotenoid cleavage dioxygenase-like enzyme